MKPPHVLILGLAGSICLLAVILSIRALKPDLLDLDSRWLYVAAAPFGLGVLVSGLVKRLQLGVVKIDVGKPGSDSAGSPLGAPAGTAQPSAANDGLLADLVAVVPMAITRPANSPIARGILFMGGVLLGSAVTSTITAWTWDTAILRVSVAFSLGIPGAMLAVYGVQLHRAHVAIGRSNGDIIQQVGARLAKEPGYGQARRRRMANTA